MHGPGYSWFYPFHTFRHEELCAIPAQLDLCWSIALGFEVNIGPNFDCEIQKMLSAAGAFMCYEGSTGLSPEFGAQH